MARRRPRTMAPEAQRQAAAEAKAQRQAIEKERDELRRQVEAFEQAASEAKCLRLEEEARRVEAERLRTEEEAGKPAARGTEDAAADEGPAQDLPEDARLLQVQAQSSVMPPQPLPTPKTRGLHVIAPSPLSCHDTKAVRERLDTDGFCVVKDILTDAEQREFRGKFFDALRKRHPAIRMENMDTWSKDNVSWHGTAGFGVFKHYGMAQEGHAWVVRQNPRIRAVFEKGVFKEECVVSLDGTCALFHAEKSKLELHVDIVKNLPGAEMHPVQGSYTLWGSEVRGDRLSAGFVVVPRSHQLFDETWAAREQLEGFKRPAKHFHEMYDSKLRAKTLARSTLRWPQFFLGSLGQTRVLSQGRSGTWRIRTI